MNGRPRVRASGEGPAVLCLHSSGASSRQWDGLGRRLAPHHRVLAADLAGHGRSPGWGPGERPSLEGEVARLAPVLADAGPEVHLVGHSYGAAVALKIALSRPARVASLVLYEPVMFGFLLEGPGRHPGGEEIVAKAGAMRAALDAGHDEESARLFVEYWSGAEGWSRLEPAQRATVAERMPAVMGCFDALFGDRSRREDLARIEVPVLLVAGSASPASSLGVAALLERSLPRLRRHDLPGVGHMGPVTHPEAVNPLVERFLAAAAARDAFPARTSREAPARVARAFA